MLFRSDPATVPVGGSPVIVFLHGGGWVIGNRANIEYGATSGPIVQMLRDGWTVISADYRLANATTPSPAQIRDVRRLVKWLKWHAGAYGLDPKKIFLSGHSAGAQLALLAGTSCRVVTTTTTCVAEFEPTGTEAWITSVNARVRGVVALAPATDLRALVDAKTYPALSQNIVSYLGCSLATVACRTKARSLEPATWLDASDPPIYVDRKSTRLNSSH